VLCVMCMREKVKKKEHLWEIKEEELSEEPNIRKREDVDQ